MQKGAGTFFVVAGLVFQCLVLRLSPPFQTPDELNHFRRAWQVSTGRLTAMASDQRVGGEVPVSFRLLTQPFFAAGFIQGYKADTEDRKAVFGVPLEPARTEFADFPNSAFYSPLSYLPQVTGIWLGRLFGLSVGGVYYCGRIMIVITWLLGMWYAVRLMPFAKWLTVTLLLLPMHVCIASSYNADTVTNILAFIAISMLLRACIAEELLTRRRLIQLLLLATGLAAAKVIYSVVFVLLAFVPPERFGSSRRKWVFVSATAVLAAISGTLWSWLALRDYIPFTAYDPRYRLHTTLSAVSDYHLQKAHLFSHPWIAFELLYNALFHKPSFYLGSFIGHFGPYMDLPFPRWAWSASWILLLFVAVSQQKVQGANRIRWPLLLTGFLVFFALVLSHHLTWNKVGSPYIDSIQGRYLIPIVPLFLYALPVVRGSGVFAFIAPVLIIALGFMSCSMLYSRFAPAGYEIICAPGKLNALRGGCGQAGIELNRSGGGYDVSSATFTLGVLHNVKPSDLMVVSVWKTGESCALQAHCGEKRLCDESDVKFTSADGCGLLEAVVSFTAACDEVVVTCVSGPNTCIIDGRLQQRVRIR